MVIIPDDPAELARESAQVRRELRWRTRSVRWRRRLHLPTRRGRQGSSLTLPLLIMAIAVLATLTSLFALAWPGQGSRSANSAPRRTGTGTNSAPVVPDLTLVGSDGTPIQLRNSLPAVILLADGCSCAELELATAQVVPAGVTVLAVGRTPPLLPSNPSIGLRIETAADPDGKLRAAFAGSPPGHGVIALLVKGTGEVVDTIPGISTVDDLRPDLVKLA